jgi:hypothetical protein
MGLSSSEAYHPKHIPIVNTTYILVFFFWLAPVLDINMDSTGDAIQQWSCYQLIKNHAGNENEQSFTFCYWRFL